MNHRPAILMAAGDQAKMKKATLFDRRIERPYLMYLMNDLILREDGPKLK